MLRVIKRNALAFQDVFLLNNLLAFLLATLYQLIFIKLHKWFKNFFFPNMLKIFVFNFSSDTPNVDGQDFGEPLNVDALLLFVFHTFIEIELLT